MRKLTWISSLLFVLLLFISTVFIVPTSVEAIGEVTPTPAPEEPTNTVETEEVDVDQLIEDGLLDVQNGDFRSAIAKMDAAIAADPEVMFAYIVRGVAHIQLGQLDNAIDDYTIAIELEPWQFDTYIFRGDAYRSNGDLTDALLDYDEAIYISPLTGSSYLRRADLNYQLGDAIAGDVDDLTARGLNSLNTGDVDTAFAFLDEAIDIGDGLSSVGSTYYVRGIASMQNGDTEQAFDDYASAIETDERLHNPYLGRGILHRQEGDIQAAGEDFYNRMLIHNVETIEDAMSIGDTIEVEMAYQRIVTIRFEGEAGQEINISANDISGTVVDPLITLLDPNGNPIAGDDDFGGALNSLIDDFELPVDGIYTLWVSHAEGGYTFGFNGLVEVEIED